MSRHALATQCSFLDALTAPPPSPAPTAGLLRPYSDPGPERPGKMAGKSNRKIATTRAYHTAFRLRATEVVVEEKRGGDVTIRGPHRYYLAELADQPGRHQVLDREEGAVVDEGPWLIMWGLALRLNGIDLLAPEVAA